MQTCRGSHTHTVLVDPKDTENVYVYISGSSRRALAQRAAGLRERDAERDPNSALFRIEVIKVPLANPEQAAIVSSPRIFNDLVAPPTHGEAPEDSAADAKALAEAKARGEFTATIDGEEQVLADAAYADRCSTASSRRAAAPARRPRPTAPRSAQALPEIDRA